MDNVIVRLENISKKYGDTYVIKDLNLDIYEGEFLTLLGPSGCGKTTILRMISGLEDITSGRIFIEYRDVTDVTPSKRPVNTIFQNFALFPHMSVYDNIAFGLKMKKVPKNVMDKRIKEAIKLVKLEGFEDRLPSELSGGQQQRVAIARGIVLNHKVLLLDESLASLDLKLKKEMQSELKKIQRKVGITFIYVTHDQDEALTMSDRIAIINNGNIEQLDTPENIYRKPKTLFAADFIGESNILKAKVISKKDGTATIGIGNTIKLDINDNNYLVNDKLNIVLRPECFDIHKVKKVKTIMGKVVEYLYDGMVSKIVVKTDEGLELKVNTTDASSIKIDDIIYLRIPKKYIIVLGEDHEKKN